MGGSLSQSILQTCLFFLLGVVCHERIWVKDWVILIYKSLRSKQDQQKLVGGR